MRLGFRVLCFGATVLLAAACSMEEVGPTSPSGQTKKLSTAFVPPGECQSYHTIIHGGGAEGGGTTIFQSDCGPQYTAWFKSGGHYYYYNGSFSFGQAPGEDLCNNFPTIYSCTVPPFDWCLYDPQWCNDNEHPDHFYEFL